MERKPLGILVVGDPIGTRQVTELLSGCQDLICWADTSEAVSDEPPQGWLREYDVVVLRADPAGGPSGWTLPAVRKLCAEVAVVLVAPSDSKEATLDHVAAGVHESLDPDDLTCERLVHAIRCAMLRASSLASLSQTAFYDALTGLPNRAVLMDHLERAVEHSRRRKDYMFALLLCDLDKFARINDSLGHTRGDELLVAVSRRLGNCVRTADTMTRLGGDDFAILLDDVQDISDALRVAERMRQAMSSPFRLAEREVTISISSGIALSTVGYESTDQVLRDAGTALNRAKLGGSGRHEIFDSHMHVQAVERLKLESGLRQALERGELRVHYQPIVRLSNVDVIGFEGLVRWQHPEEGLVPPRRFIPVAEEIELVAELDRWVMREACAQMKAWHGEEAVSQPPIISVNFSAQQLMQPELIDEIRTMLEETGLDPNCFRPEITETALMADMRRAVDVLRQLRDIDILLHLDDFGTGYSSLNYLARLDVTAVKIDRSFVAHMEAGAENLEIVRMITSLAHTLGLQVIAEGVETQWQSEELQRLGCEYGQGYYFAPPMPREEALEYLRERARRAPATELAAG